MADTQAAKLKHYREQYALFAPHSKTSNGWAQPHQELIDACEAVNGPDMHANLRRSGCGGCGLYGSGKHIGIPR